MTARGDAIPGLRDRYVFSDLCRATLLHIDADEPGSVAELPLVLPSVYGIFADPAGEILIVSPNQVARLVPG